MLQVRASAPPEAVAKGTPTKSQEFPTEVPKEVLDCVVVGGGLSGLCVGQVRPFSLAGSRCTRT